MTDRERIPEEAGLRAAGGRPGDPVLVLVTGPPGEPLERLSSAVVDEGLAACVNLVPGVRSLYRWEGAVQRDEEWLALIKTTRRRLATLRDRVEALHPYDVPEFVVVEIAGGATEYLAWVEESTDVEA